MNNNQTGIDYCQINITYILPTNINPSRILFKSIIHFYNYVKIFYLGINLSLHWVKKNCLKPYKKRY